MILIRIYTIEINYYAMQQFDENVSENVSNVKLFRIMRKLFRLWENSELWENSGRLWEHFLIILKYLE